MKGKVLIINPEMGFFFDNPNSAVAKYLLTLKSGLENDGYDVSLYPPANTATQAANSNQPSAPGSKIKKMVRQFLPALYYSLLLRRKMRFADQVSSQLVSTGVEYDLVIEFLTAGSRSGSALKKAWKVPFVVIYDSPLAEQFKEMHGTGSFFRNRVNRRERESVEQADGIICYAQAVADFLEKQFAAGSKCAILPCIVWKEKVPAGVRKGQVIGFVGSFLKWHNVQLLVEAFDILAPEFPDAQLVLLGKGVEWERTKERVLKSPYAHRIVMPGFVTEEDLAAWKQKFMIGVMPGSNWYGSPLKLFEYAEASIAIVAPRTPVVSELFTKNEALFIDPQNETMSLVNNLKALLKDNQLRESLVNTAANKMQTVYSRSEQLNTFNMVIAKILHNGFTK
jgi:glycosyltransferase involved in cell wall biosynthesis